MSFFGIRHFLAHRTPTWEGTSSWIVLNWIRVFFDKADPDYKVRPAHLVVSFGKVTVSVFSKRMYRIPRCSIHRNYSHFSFAFVGITVGNLPF